MTYVLQNFIADIGGLLGLFMGISLLSMIDSVLKFSKKLVLKRKIENQQNVTEILICSMHDERPKTPLWIVDCEEYDKDIKNDQMLESKNNLDKNLQH